MFVILVCFGRCGRKKKIIGLGLKLDKLVRFYFKNKRIKKRVWRRSLVVEYWFSIYKILGLIVSVVDK